MLLWYQFSKKDAKILEIENVLQDICLKDGERQIPLL